MQFITQKKYLIISVLFFIFSCAIFIYLFSVIKTSNETAKKQKEKWQAEVTEKDSVKFVANSIKAVSSEKEELESHFVNNSDVVPFLNTIEKIIKEVGISKSEVVSVDISPEDPVLFVEIRVSSSFESIYKLITLLENSPYDIEFVSASMHNSSDNGEVVKTKQWVGALKIKLLSFIK